MSIYFRRLSLVINHISKFIILFINTVLLHIVAYIVVILLYFASFQNVSDHASPRPPIPCSLYQRLTLSLVSRPVVSSISKELARPCELQISNSSFLVTCSRNFSCFFFILSMCFFVSILKITSLITRSVRGFLSILL